MPLASLASGEPWRHWVHLDDKKGEAQSQSKHDFKVCVCGVGGYGVWWANRSGRPPPPPPPQVDLRGGRHEVAHAPLGDVDVELLWYHNPQLEPKDPTTRAPPSTKTVPHACPTLSRDVQLIAAGKRHSLAVVRRKGRLVLVSWGNGDNGRLGRKLSYTRKGEEKCDMSDAATPVEVDLSDVDDDGDGVLDKVVQIQAS